MKHPKIVLIKEDVPNGTEFSDEFNTKEQCALQPMRFHIILMLKIEWNYEIISLYYKSVIIYWNNNAFCK